VKVGCHGLVWTGTYDAEGIRTAVRKTAEAGFDLVEFPLMDPFSFDVAAARAALDEYGIVATGSLGLSEATDISSGDPAVVEAGRTLLLRAVDVLAELGSEHLCGVLYSAMRKYMEPATEQGVESSRRVLAEVAERAGPAGVRVSLEVVNRYETNLLNTARQAREFVAGLDGVGIHLDTYHMNIEESDMFSPVVVSQDLLRYVHIGESHRGYLGTGSVDFGAFFRALATVGYSGPIVFESFSSTVVAPDLSRMLGIWRNLWSDNDELGRHANDFIRGNMTAMASLTHH